MFESESESRRERANTHTPSHPIRGVNPHTGGQKQSEALDSGGADLGHVRIPCAQLRQLLGPVRWAHSLLGFASVRSSAAKTKKKGGGGAEYGMEFY